MPAPTARAAGAAALGAVLYAYGATSQVAWLFLLALLVWTLIPAAFAYAAWNGRGLRAGLRLAEVRPSATSPGVDLPEAIFRDAPLPAPLFEGDAAGLQLLLASIGATRGPARITFRVGGTALDAGAGRIGREGWSERRDLPALRRGLVAADGGLLQAGDPLGLFRTQRRLGDREVAAAYPLFSSLADVVEMREVESQLAAPRAGHGTEVYGVREYRRGDPLRRVHWRSSARRGELVVKEMEPPGQRLVLLILDGAPAGLAVADQLARLAASEAWDCLRSGGRAVLWAPGRTATAPAQGRSLWTLLDWLARYPDAIPADPAPSPAAGEVIALLAGDREALEAAEEARLRGATTRAWTLAGASAPAGVPSRTAGLEWPL